MDPQEKRCIKAEHASMNEAVSENKQKTNDFDEVSPSATDDGPDAWNTSKCILCDKSTLRYEEVKLLECLHSACSECVNARLNESGENAFIMCNICQIPSNSLMDNHFLMECNLPSSEPNVQVNGDNSRLTNVKCTSCHDNLVASSWCVDCNDFLCDGCVQAHQRLKITKDHTIKPKEEADLESNAPVESKLKTISCPLHPQERLSLFCETCDKLTCRDCQLTEHRQHKYKFIDEIASETRRNINNLLTEVNYKRGLLKTAMRVIDDRQQQIINKKKELLNEITQMVVRLTEAFTTRGKHLVNKLNEICDSKQKTLNEKKIALEQLSLLTDHCIDFISHALEKGNDMAVLKTKNVMLKHLQIVKSKRADIPNPEIPVRIQLALDKANEICQMVNRLGVIIVDGRQHTPAVSPTPPSILPPKPVVSMASHTMSQQLNLTNANQVFVAPPGYPANNNNMMNSNPMRNVHMNMHSMRPNRFGSATMHYAATNNNQMKNVNFSGYQQQVTSSTHPQNSLYNGTNSPYDQGLRKLLMDKPNVTHTVTHPNMRPMNSSMQVVYQNADTNSMNRVQSVSPQGVSMQPNKIQYLPNMSMNKMYQQQYQTNSMTQQMMPTQQCRSNMVSPSARQILSRENSLSPLPQQTPQWHTPQISVNASMKQMPALINVNAHSSNDDSFKITLPSTIRMKPSITPPSIGVSVSSSVSKTPSPLNHQGKSSPEEAEKNLDKVGQDSVKDLIATIARLDGIEVIPEPPRKPGDSPLVDSSTGPPIDHLANVRAVQASITNVPAVVAEPQKGCDDPNEDWCAVCMDGGELVCCDNCPKVFHMNCHIPSLPILPGENDSWQCMLCSDVSIDAAAINAGKDEKPVEGGLSKQERKLAERLLLELYCQYDASLAFREIVSPEMVHYYKKIKKPMCLDMIRRKLLRSSTNPYTSLKDIIRDMFLIFHNACVYNEDGSQVHNDAKLMEDFLNERLTAWLPIYAFDNSLRVFEPEETTDEDDGLDGPPTKRCKRPLSDE